jgi:predicted choloylglycine hydrolase
MINLEEGLNEHGLAVAMEFIVPTRIVPGINSVFLVRYLLEKCETAKGAINALKNLPIASAYCMVLADKKGEMVVAECTPEKIILRRPAANENFVVAANHFVSKEMSCYNACLIFSSDMRYQTAYNALKNIKTTDGVEHAQAILSGKQGFMCRYHKALNFETIWSSVFDISNGRIYRAEGNPSRCAFREDMRSGRL